MLEILAADDLLKLKHKGKKPKPKTVDERNSLTLEMMNFSNIPNFNWTHDPLTGDIIVQSEEQPVSVHVWHATTCNAERRDWRILNLDNPCTCGFQYDEEMCANLAVLWASDTLQETYPGSLTWVAHREAPMDGRYTAFFVNLQFNSTVSNSKGWPVALPGSLEFTTTVSVVPDEFPYMDCTGNGCLGSLL